MSDEGSQVDYWSEVAGPKWVAGQRRLDALMAPLTQVLFAVADVGPGEAVLDIGCGCGETSLRAAAAAGPAGDVLAVDVSAPMLERGRERAEALEGSAPIRWEEADATAYPFAADRDLAISRFGVMFFGDRLAAFRNLHRALKPAGRAAFITWRRREEVEWMRDPPEWLAGPDAPAPVEDGGPGPFALGDGEVTCGLLAAAGFSRVGRLAVDRALVLGADVGEAAALLGEHGPAGHVIREAEPARRAAYEAILLDRLRAHETRNGIVMGAACWIYTARA